MKRRVFNVVVDEQGQPISRALVKIQLNTATFVSSEQKEVAAWGIDVLTDANGRWEVELEANDTMSDPNSYYRVVEYSRRGTIVNEYLIRIPSTGFTEPIWIVNLLITPPEVTPPPNAVTSIAADNNTPMQGDVRLLAGSGIQLQQDNNAKTITIVNTGGGSGSGGGAHNLLSDTHTDTQPTAVQRGMLIVGRLVAGIVKWAGLALGAAGKFLKSTGTDVIWGDVDWTDVQNKPPTFPPSPHTHVKADITDFAHTHPPSQISPQGAGSGLDADTVDGQHASAFAPASHTHTRSQITDFAHASTHVAGGSDPITGNLDANARVTVKQSGTVVGVRRAINFIAGSNISLSISDDAANEEVDITISAAGGGSSSHNLLDGVVHPDTEATTVQRGMLVVGKLSGAVVKWGGLPLGSAGRFLKSNGTDAVWDVIQASDLPSHTHTKSQIADLETITTTPTANAVPKADSSGKIALGWIPQGSGSNLDADKLDGLDSTAFERVANKGVANGYAPLDVNAKVPATHIADNLRVATIGLTVGDGANFITTGFKGAIPVPFSGTITEWTIVSTDANPPTSGSIEIDILKSTYSNYPTMSSIVGTGTKPNIANSNKGTGTPTGWSTTTINAGDIIGFNVVSVTNLKRITIVLKVVKS
jgi:hypothetical protein